MHESSMKNMDNFIADYLEGKTGIVIDVGSLDINGSYRELFEGWNYIGIDVVQGKNVDLVLSHPNNWWMFSNECIDVIISGQCFEHVEDHDALMLEIARTLKVGGICCIIAPSGGDPDHGLRKYKIKDFNKLAKDVGLKVVNCEIDKKSEWKDCILIAEKEREINGQIKFGSRPGKD